MSRREELDALPSGELHDRAVRYAIRHLDVGFLWRLISSVPAAEAVSGQMDDAERDISHWSSQVADAFNDDDGARVEALRPVYLEYLEEHPEA